MFYNNKKNLLFLLIFIAILSGCHCGPTTPEFQRNPNLKLLVSYADDDRTCFNPVWAPDNNRIYYLLAWPYSPPNLLDDGGQLYRIEPNGSDVTLVNDGWYGSLTISPDGSQLAVTTRGALTGGSLLIMDTLGNVIDTIATSEPTVLDIEFNWDGTKLYYYACGGSQNGFYKINVDGGGEELLKLYSWTGYYEGFDLDEKDSLLLSPKGLAFPQVNNNNPQYVVGTEHFCIPGLKTGHLMVVNMDSNEEILLDAKPYDYHPAFCYPYWSPDGNRIVFGVAEDHGEPGGYGYFELWIIENVLE